jgi:putative ABC transport system ATP-binding protein
MEVELINVTKSYPHPSGKVEALKEINLSIRKEEFAAIMGPSGSGKSTLLNLIGCLDRPTAGKVKIGGVDTNTLDREELTTLRGEEVGFIFQSFNLIPYLSAIENVDLPLQLKGAEEEERKEKASKILGELDFDEKLFDHRPSELSGGQQQRVAIARALVTESPLILADEPTGNLDRKTGKVIMDLIDLLNKKFGKTIVCVTHDAKIAEHASKRLHLEDGRLIEGSL